MGVADSDVSGGVCLRLWLAAAKGDDGREGDKLTLLDVEHLARIVVAKAVGTEIVIDMLLVSRGAGVHLINVFCAEDGALYSEACFIAGSVRSGGSVCAGFNLEQLKGLVDAFERSLSLRDTDVGRAVEDAFMNLFGRSAGLEGAFNMRRNILGRVVGSEDNER